MCQLCWSLIIKLLYYEFAIVATVLAIITAIIIIIIIIIIIVEVSQYQLPLNTI